MKKFVFITIVCIFPYICQAQEHLSFKGISFDTSIDDFCNKLKNECNLFPSKLTKQEQEDAVETRKFIGDFCGIKKCSFYVNRHTRAKIVTSLSIKDTITVLSKEVINKIIKSYDDKYGEHQVDTFFNVWYTWKDAGGEISLSIRDKGFSFYLTDNFK